MQKNKKIVFIGVGMVGASGLYSSISQNIADEYIIIDIFTDFAQGQKLDLEDVLQVTNPESVIKVGNYDDCENADIIVISAGHPQKPGETRLNMLKDNATIMGDIGIKIKDSGFEGISIIVSNPVDIMARLYQDATGFEAQRVISSGCELDTQRLRLELKRTGHLETQDCYMIGEHGDSSVGVFGKLDISEGEKQEIEQVVHNKAQEIITRKKVTHYGIGAVISKISGAILQDSGEIFCVGKKLVGECNQSNIYASLPCRIGKNGIWEKLEGIILSEEEIQSFQKSCNILEQEYQNLISR